MRIYLTCILAILCVLCTVRQSRCARILGVIPTPSYSHQIPYHPLWQELHRRGHELVVVTANPTPNVNSTRFRQIDTGELYNEVKLYNFVDMRFKGISWLAFVEEEFGFSYFADYILGHPEVREMCAPESNQTFDVVMTELLYYPAMYVLAHRFNAPLIGLSSLGILQLNEHALGGIVLPSHEYTWEMESYIGSKMSFWERLRNNLIMGRHLYWAYHHLLPQHQAIAEKYFGKNIPPMLDVLRNTSLFFVNEGAGLTPARPKLANMITFSSAHVSTKTPPVPEDLKKFMDSAKEGIIYFSLGSNAKSSSLPPEVRQVFIDVFAKLPYKVIWKYETELEGAPDNVFYRPWFPQQSILAHPNIKLFIYQGGLQSTEETVRFTVPVIGFPVLADQDYQIARMEDLGVGKCLEITTVTREQLENAIRDVINNKEYKENMVKLRNVLDDHPYDLMKNLAWWTEYVIRHKGAPHLRSKLAWVPWYQRCDVDVVVFLTVVVFVTVSTVLKLVFKFIVYKLKQSQSTPDARKQKIS